MEDSNNNKITKNPDLFKETPDVNIESFFKEISKKLSIQNKIHIFSKILNEASDLKDEEKIIHFSFKVFKNTDINPFIYDVIFDMELNHNKNPYVRIRSDFAFPSMYDNRNYFYCLTNEHNFIYKCNNLDKLVNLLKDITNNGIENFLFCLKENSEVETFVYYGEYQINKIYNMNDFLENNKIMKIYRVQEIVEEGKDTQEKYIVLTHLYFLVFKPVDSDKSLAELKFSKLLKNICFNYKKGFSKKLNENTLILYIQDIKTPNGVTYEIEFALIDRSRPPVEKKDEEDEEDEKDENNEKDKTDKKENTINDEWIKYYKFEDEIEKKQKEINFTKFKLVVQSYKPFFEHRSIEENNLEGFDFKNTIMDYEKMFQHCEKVYNHYIKLKDAKK